MSELSQRQACLSLFCLTGTLLTKQSRKRSIASKRGDLSLLWLFMPLRYQTKHMYCSLRRNSNLSTSCSFRVIKKDILTSITQEYPFSSGYHRFPCLAINCKLVKMGNWNKVVNSLKILPCCSKKPPPYVYLLLPLSSFPPWRTEMHTFTACQKWG